MISLTPESAWIFRITHIENVQWILGHGLRCRNSELCDPNYIEIGSPDLIAKRQYQRVRIPPGGLLSDYIPFYFTPCSPMLLNIKTGYHGVPKREMAEIVILISSLRRVAKAGIPFVFTDRHASLMAAVPFNTLDHLDRIDWGILQRRDFKRDPDDLGKFECYQAEALIYQHLPVALLTGIGCYGPAEHDRLRALLQDAKIALKVGVVPDWYA